MNIAVIKSGSSQYVVRVGKIICVDKIDKPVEETVLFDDILASNKVEAQIIEHGKAKKVRVFKFKNKTGYKKTQGHRQDFTKIKITTVGDEKAAKKKSAIQIKSEEKAVKKSNDKPVAKSKNEPKAVKVKEEK